MCVFLCCSSVFFSFFFFFFLFLCCIRIKSVKQTNRMRWFYVGKNQQTYIDTYLYIFHCHFYYGWKRTFISLISHEVAVGVDLFDESNSQKLKKNAYDITHAFINLAGSKRPTIRNAKKILIIWFNWHEIEDFVVIIIKINCWSFLSFFVHGSFFFVVYPNLCYRRYCLWDESKIFY